MVIKSLLVALVAVQPIFVGFGDGMQKAEAQPQANQSEPGAVLNLPGDLEIPGLFKIHLDGGADSNKSDSSKAMATIHTLAVNASEKTNDPFSSYTRAREALDSIRQVAKRYDGDPTFQVISNTATRTFEKTDESWGPFDQTTVSDALKTIIQLSQ